MDDAVDDTVIIWRGKQEEKNRKKKTTIQIIS